MVPLSEVITPGVVLLPIWDVGYLRLGWLRALNPSSRNSRLFRSPILKILDTARLSVTLPGPSRMLRPELPNVPDAGTEKHEASNHRWMVRFEIAPLQVRLGRVGCRKSCFPLDRGRERLAGVGQNVTAALPVTNPIVPRIDPVDRCRRKGVADVEIRKAVLGARIEHVLVRKVTAAAAVVHARLRIGRSCEALRPAESPLPPAQRWHGWVRAWRRQRRPQRNSIFFSLSIISPQRRKPVASDSEVAPPAFMELVRSAGVDAGEYVVEFESGAGLRMRVRWRGTTPEWGTLLRAWREVAG